MDNLAAKSNNALIELINGATFELVLRGEEYFPLALEAVESNRPMNMARKASEIRAKLSIHQSEDDGDDLVMDDRLCVGYIDGGGDLYGFTPEGDKVKLSVSALGAIETHGFAMDLVAKHLER